MYKDVRNRVRVVFWYSEHLSVWVGVHQGHVLNSASLHRHDFINGVPHGLFMEVLYADD